VLDASFIAAITGFDGLPIPGGIIELDGTIAAVNQALERLVGRRADQVIGSKVWELAPGLDHVWAELIEIARAQGEYRDHIVIAMPAGTRSVEYVMTVREAEGRAVVLAFALDITRHMPPSPTE
jgi:PAS domain S-box-containing protein